MGFTGEKLAGYEIIRLVETVNGIECHIDICHRLNEIAFYTDGENKNAPDADETVIDWAIPLIARLYGRSPGTIRATLRFAPDVQSPYYTTPLVIGGQPDKID